MSEPAPVGQKPKHDLLTAIVEMLFKFLNFFLSFTFKQITNERNHNWEFLWGFSLCVVFALVMTYAPNWPLFYVLSVFGHYKLVTWLSGWTFAHTAKWVQALFIFLPVFYGTLICRHFVEVALLKRYQGALDHLGLVKGAKHKLTALEVIRLNKEQRKIVVDGKGIDIEDLKKKKGALESGLNLLVQDIRRSKKNLGIFEILASTKDLPTLLTFDEVEDAFGEPYSFVVGASMSKLVTATLGSVHHMLIAGATGNGKSLFFKQVLVGLLKSSKNIQIYLIDLKRGVEVKAFAELSNVKVFKEHVDAIKCLSVINDEMEKRFQFLEKNNLTEIDPVRDKMDRIVVGIDEASVLFTVERMSKINRDNAISARELTDKIAKLGRAAGIHLIVATQKVVKETIDTRVQTNINARLCFRVGTTSSSLTAIGTTSAAALPACRGRGVWSVGSVETIVQTPRLLNEEMPDEIEILTQKFNGKDKNYFGPMVSLDVREEVSEKVVGDLKIEMNETNRVKAT